MNNHILEFTLDETKELFRQFEEDYKAGGRPFTLDPRIIEDIHEQTAGHAGLVNAVGRFIQDNLSKGAPTWEEWALQQQLIVDYISAMSVREYMFQSVEGYDNKAFQNQKKQNANPAIRVLLQLCATETGLVFEDRNDVHRLLLDMGFVKKSGEDKLVIESPLIKALVQRKIFPLIDPQINNLVPFNKDGSLNILDSLKIIVQNMDHDMIGWSYDTGFKKLGNEEVPSESVYHNEMFRILQRWFGKKSWQLSTNVRSMENGQIRLDLVLSRSERKVGLELVASSTVKDIKEHAERPYKQELSLTQYVVIHFTAQDGKVTDLLEHAGVPIYHVVHNNVFDDVKIHYLGVDGKKETVQVIPQPN